MDTKIEEKRDAGRKMWDQRTSWYMQFETFSFQGTMTCLAMTNA
jgi:hypothetical protein